MKGILTSVLIGLTVLALGISCGGTPEPKPTPQPSSPSPPPVAPSPIVWKPPTPTVELTPHSNTTGYEALGLDIANRQGCLGCHTVDGTALIGPTWKGLFGKVENLEDGGTVTVDESYISESIRDPGASVVQGFTNIMPAFGSLAQEDIDAIIAYIRSLR